MKKDFITKLVQQIFILVSVIVVSSSSLNAQTKESRNWAGTYAFTDSAQKSKRQNRYDVAPMTECVITVKKSGKSQSRSASRRLSKFWSGWAAAAQAKF